MYLIEMAAINVKTLECHRNDYYEYNKQSWNTGHSGERAFFEVTLTQKKLYSFELKATWEDGTEVDLKPKKMWSRPKHWGKVGGSKHHKFSGKQLHHGHRGVRVMIVTPSGRVTHNQLYRNKVFWYAKELGTYLFKIWTGPIPGKYTVSWQGDGLACVHQKIYSPAHSESDGALLDKDENKIIRKNGIFQGTPLTRSDRKPASTR